MRRNNAVRQRQVHKHKEAAMSPEMIAIIAVGIAVMGVQISTCICLARRMDAIQAEIAHVKTSLTKCIDRIEGILIGQ